MQVTYGLLWSDELGEVTDPMTEEQARARDASGEQYCVVLGDPARPDAVIDVVGENNYIGVNFVNDNGWTELNYTFRQSTTQPGRLFMTEAVTWEYGPESQFDQDAPHIETLLYLEGGGAELTVSDEKSGVSTARHDHLDVSTNWEDIPDWSAPEDVRWASIARRDRSKPAV